MSRTRFLPGPLRADRLNLALDELEGLYTGTPVSSAPSGQFYSDRGASISRYPDRLFVGAGTDNQGKANRDALPNDWLSVLMGSTSIGAYPVWGATLGSLARHGTIGVLGASRTSDARANAALLGYTPASIGIASWGINDDTTAPTLTTAWAYYGEAWRMPGQSYQPTFGMELEGVNLGGLPVGLPNPYKVNVGGGVVTVQLGSGGGQKRAGDPGVTGFAASDISAFQTFVSNPSRAQAGLVFGADALAGTNGEDAGYASAMMLGRNQAIQWHTPETPAGNVKGANLGAYIRSVVTQAAKLLRFEFQDSGAQFFNAAGQTLFGVGNQVSAGASLQVQAGSGGGSAGLYVQAGTGQGQNLGLFMPPTGRLQVQGQVSAGAGNAGVVPAGGFLPINVNGQDFRIPLLSPAQAGA